MDQGPGTKSSTENALRASPKVAARLAWPTYSSQTLSIFHCSYSISPYDIPVYIPGIFQHCTAVCLDGDTVGGVGALRPNE